ncbi:MAG: DUF917 domain-containing protein [Actinobacteria bacterium]|nr:DUF917 domain-containing protein [Actinomycetota bacterium]
MRLETEQDSDDFLRGLTLLGTGGGGPPELGREALRGALPVECRALSELPPDTWTATVAELGSGASGEPPPPEEAERLGLTAPGAPPMLAALRELADSAGVELGAVVPGEIGAGNVPGPIAAAVALGLTPVDVDYGGGRALPELSQSVPAVLGRSVFPVSMVDVWGNVTVLRSGTSAAMADRIGRALTEAVYGDIAFACYLMRADEATGVMAHGTLTRALEAGRAIREARARGADPVTAAADAIGATVLFRGDVVSTGLEGGGHAFGVGRHQLAAGRDTFTIWFKNESHVSWLNGESYVTSPDCLAVIDLETGEPHTNYEVAEGQRVAVLGWRGADAHRTPRGLELLGPRHFGFDLDYVPVEKMFK